MIFYDLFISLKLFIFAYQSAALCLASQKNIKKCIQQEMIDSKEILLGIQPQFISDNDSEHKLIKLKPKLLEYNASRMDKDKSKKQIGFRVLRKYKQIVEGDNDKIEEHQAEQLKRQCRTIIDQIIITSKDDEQSQQWTLCLILELSYTLFRELQNILSHMNGLEYKQTLHQLDRIYQLLCDHCEIIASYSMTKSIYSSKDWVLYSILIFFLSKVYESHSEHNTFHLNIKQSLQSPIIEYLAKIESAINNLSPKNISLLKSIFFIFPVHQDQRQPLIKYFKNALRNFIKSEKFFKIDSQIIITKENKANNYNILVDTISEILLSVDSESNCWLSKQENIEKEEVTKKNVISISHYKIWMQWITLLINICDGAIIKNQNSNKFLQYCIEIILYLEQSGAKADEEENKAKKYLANMLSLYIGQLCSLIIYRNPYFVINFCRKRCILPLVLSIWHKSYNYLNSKSQQLDEIQYRDIIEKRVILGYIGLMRIDSFETQVQNIIRKFFPLVIKSIEKNNGFDEQEQTVEQLSLQAEQKQIQLMGELNEYWNEQYYYKNSIEKFEEINEVEELKISMKNIHEKSPEIFSQLIENFTAQEIIMWTIELEEKNDD